MIVQEVYLIINVIKTINRSYKTILEADKIKAEIDGRLLGTKIKIWGNKISGKKKVETTNLFNMIIIKTTEEKTMDGAILKIMNKKIRKL